MLGVEQGSPGKVTFRTCCIFNIHLGELVAVLAMLPIGFGRLDGVPSVAGVIGGVSSWVGVAIAFLTLMIRRWGLGLSDVGGGVGEAAAALAVCVRVRGWGLMVRL